MNTSVPACTLDRYFDPDILLCETRYRGKSIMFITAVVAFEVRTNENTFHEAPPFPRRDPSSSRPRSPSPSSCRWDRAPFER